MTQFLISMDLLATGLRSSLVKDKVLLSGHGIVHSVEPWLVRDSRDDGLHAALKLLLIVSILRRHRRLSVSVHAVEAHSLKLLRSSVSGGVGNVNKLLLQTPLLLSEIVICRHEFAVEIRIDLISIMLTLNLYSRWSKDLFRQGIHLIGAVEVRLAFGEVGANRGLRYPTSERIVLFLRLIVQAKRNVWLKLCRWG